MSQRDTGDGTAAFSIGTQQAGTINNVVGDQTVGHSHSVLHIGALQAVGELRSAVAAAALPLQARQAADEALDEMQHELGNPAPDKRRVADRLEQLAGLLGRVGVLTAAANNLVTPLRHLAAWLGPAGQQVLRLLS